MNRRLPTVRGALEAGCRVDGLCYECRRLSRLDPAMLAQDGHRDTVLISVPVVCVCGSKRSQIINSDPVQPI
jgi:hypothetical protein